MKEQHHPPASARKLNIAVIGGSISGCLAAALLRRSGHRVNVYERSGNDLQGRGGGIATSATLINKLKSEALVDADFPTVFHGFLRLAVKTAEEPILGKCTWGPALDMQCVHWSGLFKELRSRIDNAQYHLNKELTDVIYTNYRPTMVFADNSSEQVDLIVFCDGFRSLGRRLMHPDVELDYRGYVVWRGTLEESLYDAGSALNEHPRLSFATMPGSFITYLMPSESGSAKPGERVINWAAYLPVATEELAHYMVDRSGHLREGTVPAGHFPITAEQRLKALMREQLPSVFSDIVSASVDTQFQPIRTTRVPSHYANRLCLVGDAAVAIQPMTGSGAFKAFENARTLDEAVNAKGDLESNLRAWSERQTDLDHRLLATGLSMEQAFIWKTIDLATATADEIENWWQGSIEYKPEYAYMELEHCLQTVQMMRQ
ncbi:MAG: FAD-dependent monooxygenase [Granulosicoccus sp.]